MMNKTRLIKKNELDNAVTKPAVATPPQNQELLEKRNQFLATHKAMQVTKDWLASRRQEQGRARETFANLFAF